MPLSVNKNALRLVDWAMGKREDLGIEVVSGPLGCTIVDAGVKAVGGHVAGRWVAEVCLGGCGFASLTLMQHADLVLPSILVETDFPAIATLGSQLAGWNVRTKDYFAMGSGPARALSKKPKKIYELIQYEDRYDSAVIVLEADSFPTEEAVKTIAYECEISTKNLYVIVAPTSSIVGSIQVSGRTVETGIHKLLILGLDPRLVSYGCGCAPVPPVHPENARAIGRTNDALIYGGVASYSACVDSDHQLEEIVSRCPSSSAHIYGKPFYEIFKEAGFDFYRIDPHLFAPAMVSISNTKTGTTLKAGKINIELLKRAMGIATA